METGRNRARAHLQEFELRRYRRRQMEPDELLSANDHLAACDECYDDFGGEVLLESTYRFARSSMDHRDHRDRLISEHPSYGQMAAYVDGQSSEAARKETGDHLASCAQCREDVHELMQLRDELRAGGEVTPALRAETRQSPANRPAVRLPLEIAAVATAFIAGGWLLSSNLRGRVDDLSRETIELRRTNQELRHEIEHKALPEKAATDKPAEPPGSSATIPFNTGPTGRLVVALKDGGRRVTLDASGNVEGYDSLPPRYLGMIREALKTGRVAMALPLSVPAVSLRGTPKTGDQSTAFGLVSPIATSVIEIQPLLRWEPLSGATSYSVAVYGRNYQEVLAAKDIRGTEWRVSRALTRGDTYLWQVTAFKDGKEVVSPGSADAEARFRVIGKTQAAEIEQAKRRWGDSSLLLGLIYARAGLQEEAAEKFRALREANPSSALVGQLAQAFKDR
jgi:hypothetical protein